MTRRPTRYVVFGQSAADVLGQARAMASIEASVACIRANYSLGPIDPPAPDTRRAWFLEHVDGEVPLDDEGDWDRALSPDHRLIAWTCRRTSWEASGFLAWVSRLEGRPCEVIDLTDPVAGPGGGKPKSLDLALMQPEEVLALSLLGAARPLDGATRERLVAEWTRLRGENAPVRLATGAAMRSAPITVFDDQLLAAVGPEWTGMSMALGRVLGEFYRTRLAQSVLGLLEARVRAMIAEGRLQAKGDPREIAGCQLRLG